MFLYILHSDCIQMHTIKSQNILPEEKIIFLNFTLLKDEDELHPDSHHIPLSICQCLKIIWYSCTYNGHSAFLYCLTQNFVILHWRRNLWPAVQYRTILYNVIIFNIRRWTFLVYFTIGCVPHADGERTYNRQFSGAICQCNGYLKNHVLENYLAFQTISLENYL